MQYVNKKTTTFRNAHKVNESCNGILITTGVQEHGMNILFLLHNNGFDYLQEDKNKEKEK